MHPILYSRSPFSLSTLLSLGGKNSLGFTVAADLQQMLAAACELCCFPVSPRLSLLPDFCLHLLQPACLGSSSLRWGLWESGRRAFSHPRRDAALELRWLQGLG